MGASGIRAGIVGTGFMGQVHARSVVSVGAELVGLVGSSTAKARVAAAEFGPAEAFGDLDSLLRAGVDVVHVCTPNSTHADLAGRVIDAGVNVICEKPLAISVDSAADLSARARAAGVVATVPFVYRFYASVREARQRINQPGHRPPWLLHGSYLQDWMADETVNNWRVDAAAGGVTRAFGDIGVHWCDLAEFVTGQRIVEVNASFARMADRRPGSDGTPRAVSTEDGAVLLLRTDAGAVGSLVVSQASAGRKNRLWFSFDGPESTYVFDQEAPETLWIGGREASQIVVRDPSRAGAPHGRSARLPTGHPQGYYEAFADFVADTYAAIGGEHVDGLPTFEDGLRAAVITEAVVRSAELGTWQPTPDTFALREQ